MLRKYETLYILKPDSAPEKTEAARAKIRDVVTGGGAFLVKEDVWGKKKLAFEIQKQSKGIFVLLVYLSAPDHITEIERNLKIHSEVVRYVTVKVADTVNMEAEQAEKERWDAEAARRAAEAAAHPPREIEEPEEERDDFRRAREEERRRPRRDEEEEEEDEEAMSEDGAGEKAD
jgi:small subunit ribosomal protein S6